MPWTDDNSISLPSPPTTSLFANPPHHDWYRRMADPNDTGATSKSTPAPSGPPTTPGSRRNVAPLSPLPPLSPLVQSVTARVMADADRKLSTLQSQVDALKAREEQRNNEYSLARRDASQLTRSASTPAVPPRTPYPSFDEADDYGDLITDAERKRMKQELDTAYRYRREQMFKQMQLGFRQQQAELVRRSTQSPKKKKNKSKKDSNKKKGKGKEKDRNGLTRWGDQFSDSESSSSEEDSDEESDDDSDDDDEQTTVSPWDRNSDFEALKRARAKVDVVVCTTNHVPNFRIAEKLGTFKIVVPRSLLSYDESPEELENAFQMAKMVRQEVIDKAVGQARRRKANAIIDFKFKTELSQNMHDDNVVLITASGKCCLVRRLISEGEQYLRRKMEESRKKNRRERDVSILRDALDRNQSESERRAQAKALCQLDERELRNFLDELQGKHSAQLADARRKEDPHRDALEKLLGQRVKFDDDPYANSRPGPPPGRGPEAAANMIQEMFAQMLAGQAGRAFTKPGPSGSPAGRPAPRDWSTTVADDDGGKDEEMWEAYDWK